MPRYLRTKDDSGKDKQTWAHPITAKKGTMFDLTPKYVDDMRKCTLCVKCINLIPGNASLQQKRRNIFFAQDDFGNFAPIKCPIIGNTLLKRIIEEPENSPNVTRTPVTIIKNGKEKSAIAIAWSDTVKATREIYKQVTINTITNSQ